MRVQYWLIQRYEILKHGVTLWVYSRNLLFILFLTRSFSLLRVRPDNHGDSVKPDDVLLACLDAYFPL